MKKTPSYLKGLAETHARAAGDVQRLETILGEVTAKLAESKIVLVACDRLIRKFDDRLKPNLIAPIRAWQGRYGSRGELRTTICQILKDAAPVERTTFELCIELQLKFGLEFATSHDYRRWQRNSVLNALKALMKMGLVERLHTVTDGLAVEMGRWRWKSEINTVDELRVQAAAQGVGVQQAPEEDNT